MSRKSRKPEDPTLRKELKKLQVEINQLKKASKNIYILSGNDQQKLILTIQENLNQNIYPPPKCARSKSPLSRRPNKSPASKTRQNSSLPEVDKENCPSFSDNDFLSPHFPSSQEVIKEEKNETFESFSTLLTENQENLKTTENQIPENQMMKMLEELKRENEKLKSQIKLRPTSVKNKDKFKKKHLKNKVSFIENNEKSYEGLNMVQGSLGNGPLALKSQKILKNSRNTSSQFNEPTLISIKIMPPSEIVRSPKDLFKNSILFPGTSKNGKRHNKVISSSFSKSINKSPTNISIGNFDISITPRGQSCKNCDSLLFKGRSTSNCPEHLKDL
jgi:hypothetical protein